MKDELGTRMKLQYEDRTRYSLPRRTYTILRLDGKAFHTYTRNLIKPFDDGLVNDLVNATQTIIKEIHGAQFAYIQSDEISILLTDFAEIDTCAWFDGNIQKICSVSSSLLTSEFNHLRFKSFCHNTNYINKDNDLHFFKLAQFDARVFTIPEPVEVYNYFVWRNQDAIRNSLSSVAQSLYSPKELLKVGHTKQLEMVKNKGTDWNNLPEYLKFGYMVIRQPKLASDYFYVKRPWVKEPAWKFTETPLKLQSLIPPLPKF